MSYVDEVIASVIEKNPAEPEFHQAVREVLESLRPVTVQQCDRTLQRRSASASVR